MSGFLENVQYRLKSSSSGLALMFFRIAVGAFLGLTFALVGEQTISYGGLAFTLVVVTSTMVFMKISSTWKTGTVLVFTLICVLVGLLLRMYIMVAPGA